MANAQSSPDQDGAAVQADDEIAPRVRLGGKGVPLAVSIGAIVLAGFAFSMWVTRGIAPEEAVGIGGKGDGTGGVLASPPPLDVPAAPPTISYEELALAAQAAVEPEVQVKYVQSPPIIQYIERASAAPMPSGPPVANVDYGRLAEPALVIDRSTVGVPLATTDDAAARAVVLRNRSMLVPQGALIPAVLETPIDTSAAGQVRAVTTGDTRSFDGTRILIPRGSRLTGEFRSEVMPGQKRVLITWNRLVRPDGVAIKLASPATDTLGQAGVAGSVNSHFLQRLAASVLQTALSIGTNLASRPDNGNSIIVGVPGQTPGSIGQSFEQAIPSRPTIKVKAGAQIMVMVARDLDFTGTMRQR